jgi:RimJ/RimL family protein N-acetyltransferase
MSSDRAEPGAGAPGVEPGARGVPGAVPEPEPGARGVPGAVPVVVAEPIFTRRLALLPLRAEHAAEMAAVLADPELHAFIGGAPLTWPALRSRYERLVAGSPDPAVSWCNWVIRLRDPGCLTGTVQATIGASDGPVAGGPVAAEIAPVAADGPVGSNGPVADGPVRADGPVAEIAWVVGTPWQGQGIATEAAQALVAWLARQSVGAVVAHIHPRHQASAAVATAAGLVPTGQWHDGEIQWRLPPP